MNKTKYSSSVILSIILFIIGAILFAKSEEVFSTVTLVVGIILSINALISILSYFYYQKKGYKDFSKISTAVISLVFAIIFLFFNKIIYTAFNFIVGGWILFIGINRLIKGISHKRVPLMVMSAIIIILAVYIILNGAYLFLETVGIIMMIYAAIDIINFIMYGKEDIEENKTKLDENTELIVTKKEKRKLLKKNNKIKDVEPE